MPGWEGDVVWTSGLQRSEKGIAQRMTPWWPGKGHQSLPESEGKMKGGVSGQHLPAWVKRQSPRGIRRELYGCWGPR